MADKIVAEYIVKTDKAVAELNKIVGRLDAIEKERKQTQDGFKSMSKNMVRSFKQVGAAIGLAFGTSEIISFGKEAVKLASQMEGVERAFKRIGGANSANLLDGLRKATRGTVSDLVLMQKAVQASNFKIPLENLASLFKFAQARARETGESVEYLTNSIVLGIGRKSPLILDNLGISAVELRTRLKGVGVEAANVGDIAQIIGDIATEELEKMGEQADTTADKIAQMGVAMENFQVQLGQELITSFSELNTEVEKTLQLFDVEGVDAFGLAMGAIKHIIDDLTNPFIFLNKILQQFGGAWQLLLESFGFSEGLIGDIKKQLEETGEAGYTMADGIGAAWAAIKAGKKDIEVSSNTINQLNTELKDLKKRFNDAEIGGSEWNQLVIDISKKTSELEAATTKATAKLIMFQQAARGFDPFAVDEFDDTSAEGIGLDLSSLDKENNAISEAVDDQVAIRQDGSDRIQDIVDEQLRASLEANDKELESAKKLAEDKAQIREQEFQKFQMYAQAVSSIVGSIAQIQSNLVQQEIQQLDVLLEQGEISREEYDQRRRELLREQAESQKAAAIFQATVDGAVAVISAFKEGGPVLAALVGAAVASQIAVIASQPLPQFAEGGFITEHGEIKGRRHAQGGVLIEAEGNEFITKGKYAQQNADILRAINSGQWEKYKMENIIAPAINQVLDGGFQGMGASYMLQNKFNDKNLLKLGDRNRRAAHEDAKYIVSELKKVMNPRKRGGFA